MKERPYSRDAEEGVVGGLLINPAEYQSLSLIPDDFYLEMNGWIYKAIGSLVDQNLDVDYITVSEELDSQGRLQEMGSHLTKVMNNVPSSLHIRTYAKTVKDKAIRRMAIKQAEEIVKLAYKEEDLLDLSGPIDMMTSLSTKSAGAEHWSNALQRTLSIIETRDKGDRIGLPFGIPSVDQTTNGARPGTMILLAGPPGVGKTVLGTQISMLWAIHGPGVIYSCEMEEEAMMTRIISAGSNIPEDRLEIGDIYSKEVPVLQQKMEEMKSAPVHFSDSESWTTHELRADLTKLKYQYGIKWFYFDYLQLLEDSVKGEEHEQIGVIAKRMRKICRGLGLTGLVISSVIKSGFDVKRPTLADLRGSGQALHEGDIVYWLHKWEANKDNDDDVLFQRDNKRYLHLMRRLYELKKRKGSKHLPTGGVTLRFAPGVPKMGELLNE